MRILFFGDVVAQPGRTILREFLPDLRAEHAPDVVIANVENLAHGKGITKKTLQELLETGVDFCTSGNHILAKEGPELLADPSIPVIRPANFPAGTPGRGAAIVEAANERLLVINLNGTAFMRDGATYENPFATIDMLLEDRNWGAVHGVLVDWHAEATSEKIAMGWHLDGRVSAVFGTHTHVATADSRILPQGTAYCSDVGMTGLRDEVLGVGKDIILHNMQHPDQTLPHRWDGTGSMQLHGLLFTIDPGSRRCTNLERIDREVEV